MSVQARAVSTLVLWCPDFSNWALSQLQVPGHSRWTQQAELLGLPKIPVPTWWLLTAGGSLLGHGRCTWASNPLRSNGSSLRTARGNRFFLFFWNIQSKVLFQIWFPYKPQSPTLALMPAPCPLPSKPLLPESAVGAKSFDQHVWKMGQRNSKIQPSVEASWESPLRWDPGALLGSLGLCPWAVRHGGGAWWLLFLLASRSHSSRQQHRGSCGVRELSPAEPILISFPTPTAGWSHSPPCVVSGWQQGEAKDPTQMWLHRREKNKNQQISFSKSFILEKKKIIYSEISREWFIRHAIPPLPISAADRALCKLSHIPR